MHQPLRWSHMMDKRLFAVLLLSFSSGLPYALVNGTLQMWYMTAGFSLTALGAITLISMPYTFKFLWSPLMDRYAPGFLGRRRSWLLLMQLCVVAGLVVMGFLQPRDHAWLLASVAVVVAFFSASQDITFDAYRTDILQPEERGLGAGFNTIGYRFALLVSGAFAVGLAVHTSWRLAYWLMAGLMALEVLVTFWAPRPEQDLSASVTLKDAIVDPLRDIFKRPGVFSLLLLIVLYKLCDAFALSLSSAFLVRGVGFDVAVVAGTTKVVGLIASLLGALVGGWWVSRMTMWRSLWWFGILQMLSNVTYLLLALTAKHYASMVSAVFVEFFFSGVSAVAFVAFLMSLCQKKFSATQYAIFSALAAVAHTFIGPLAGWVAQGYGWVIFYIISIFLGLPALALLWWLKAKGQVFEL